ncbi:DUF6804 family protein [Virgifigura deserti]
MPRVTFVDNPFVPVHLGREIWAVVDLLAAVLLAIHYRHSKRNCGS